VVFDIKAIIDTHRQDVNRMRWLGSPDLPVRVWQT